jgi:hypothetical protein
MLASMSCSASFSASPDPDGLDPHDTNTKVVATKVESAGGLQGIRHMIAPSPCIRARCRADRR